MAESNTPEADMSAPLLAWLVADGWTPYVEIPDYQGYRTIDVVATKPQENTRRAIWSIEMKAILSREVIEAGGNAKHMSDFVSVCIATNPKSRSIDRCDDYSLGVISVRCGVVNEICPPFRLLDREPYHEERKQELLKRLSQMKPGGTAGLPCPTGKGPAQDVARRVASYLAEHGETEWEDLYRHVPNHYAHLRSMRIAMTHSFDVYGNPCESRLAIAKRERGEGPKVISSVGQMEIG